MFLRLQSFLIFNADLLQSIKTSCLESPIILMEMFCIESLRRDSSLRGLHCVHYIFADRSTRSAQMWKAHPLKNKF